MQRVDFYFEEYRPKPLSFDSRFALAFIAIVAVGLVVIGFIQSFQITNLKAQLTKKQKQAATLLQETEVLQKKLAQSSDVESLEQEFDFHAKRLAQYQKAISAVNFPATGQSDAFSEILAALADRNIDNLWLTKIDIDGQHLTLHGRTTQSNAIPLYVDDLKNAQPLNREFDELSIVRNTENERFIDFSLFNGRKIGGR